MKKTFIIMSWLLLLVSCSGQEDQNITSSWEIIENNQAIQETKMTSSGVTSEEVPLLPKPQEEIKPDLIVPAQENNSQTEVLSPSLDWNNQNPVDLD